MVDTEEKRFEIKSIGAEPFIPRSLASGLDDGSVSKWTPDSESPGTSQSSRGGTCDRSPLPEQLLIYISPRSDSDLSEIDIGINPSAVAVIGIACRFPRADSVEDYWRLISTGTSTVQRIPEDRFCMKDFWREPKGSFWGNFLNDPKAFDHRFFSISGREAKFMDPQQRLVLQVVYEAMESSGYYGPCLGDRPANVGCYVGVGSVDYEMNVASENATAFSALGTLRAFISGRVSHHFGWNGPSITYDTACSSSAVAIHSACKALQAGACSMAVAGGVHVMTSPELFQNLAAGGFLSPTGASKAFDSSANGYCRGEGAGIVVLKPLARAVAESDAILGVIAGSAVNQGSKCTPITVPVSESQSALYEKALNAAGIESKDISYVEAHGTGTPVGDPIECESIRRTFGGAQRTELMYFGSVKDNIGHSEAASGAAATIKTILMMQKRTIPKQVNFSLLNIDIPPLALDQMCIPKQTQSWKSSSQRNAVINNYGAAGSNAAIVLQESVLIASGLTTSDQILVTRKQQDYPFIVAAKIFESLQFYCAFLRDMVSNVLETDGNRVPADFAYNLAIKQNYDHEYRWTTTSDTFRTLTYQLEQAAAGAGQIIRLNTSRRSVVLCFGGQTGRVVSISESLFYNCRLLQLHLGECESICKTLSLPSIFPSIFQREPLQDVVELHCQLFSLQYACAKSWLDSGLKVDILVGHSFGQLTALCVAGSLSLEDSIRFISTRARMIRDQWASETGVMLAVEGDQDMVEALLVSAKRQNPCCLCEIACYNGPRHFVLAGDIASIEVFEVTAHHEQQGTNLKMQRLKNTHVFHFRFVDRILPGLEDFAKSLEFRPPLIAIETCTAGETLSNLDAKVIAQHSRKPVYFAAAIERIAKRLGSSIWLEAGSSTPIIAMIKRILSTKSGVTQSFHPIDIADAETQSNLSEATCAIWRAGARTQFWPFHRSQKAQYSWLNLPPYQFEKTRHWWDLKPSLNHRAESSTPRTLEAPELLSNISENGNEMMFFINTTHAIFELCTRGHAVLHHSLCSASMYFELAIRAAKMASKPSSTNTLPRIQALEISSPLSLSSDKKVYMQLVNGTMSIPSWHFTLFSRDASETVSQVTHASGLVSLLASDASEVLKTFHWLNRLIGNRRCENIMNAPVANGLSGAIVYKNFSRVVDYAEYYRGVKRVFAKDHEAVGHISIPQNQPHQLTDGCCDPVVIDNFLQVSGIHVNCLWECKDDEVFVCAAIRELSVSEEFMNKPADKRTWTVYSNFELGTAGQVVNDIFVLDSESSQLVLTLMGAEFTRLPLKSLSRTLSRLNNAQPPVLLVQPNHQAVSRDVSEEHHELQTPVDADEFNAQGPIFSSQENQAHVFKRLQNVLSDVLEVNVGDITSDSSLNDLGIDSLMVTEVISEIKAHFGVAISNTDFQGLRDVQSLSLRLEEKPAFGQTAKTNRNTLATGDMKHTSSSFARQDTSRETIPVLKEVSGKNIDSTGLECFASVKWAFDAVAKEASFLRFSRDVRALQSQLVLAYVVEAFQTLGCPLGSLDAGQPVPKILHSPTHEKVVRQYYCILSEANIITNPTKDARRTMIAVPKVSAGDLHTQIIQKFPQHTAEHSLLHITGSKLAKCLTEEGDPIALLFGNAPARALMTDVYTNAPMFKSGTIVLGQYLSKLFETIDRNRELRILEVGAGTGGTTGYLVDMLARRGRKFQYTFTDLSVSLVTAVKKKFARYEFMKFITLDIEQEPTSRRLGRYDIIISTNCIHATKNLVTSTSNIKSMLNPNGVLCLVELTQNLFWFDLVFGLLEGWWLFEDGRQHVLADERLWEQSLHQAGFQWIDWTEGESQESQIIRVIAASPCGGTSSSDQQRHSGSMLPLPTQETAQFDEVDGIKLFADLYYPTNPDAADMIRPSALMIHGGGHVMLSRKDVRLPQAQMLIEAGYLPVSIDYRLCPESTLVEGPMHDVCSAYSWTRRTLPTLRLQRADIRPNGDRIVVVGWSTGGHLAMTLAWTAPLTGLPAPAAILCFYCPTDYEDPFWKKPNVPLGAETDVDERLKSLQDGLYDSPITAYNPPASSRALGGWMAADDARSRICLFMNRQAMTLSILLNGLKKVPNGSSLSLPSPRSEEIQRISPLAQIRNGAYRTPTFIVHGTGDDLIPWQQAQRTFEALREVGVVAELRIVKNGIHLFDISKGFGREEQAREAVRDGYEFLKQYR